MCALIGGLDLSIPFVLGAANVGLVQLMNDGMPSGSGIIAVLVPGGAIGAFNGALSHRLRGQSLVVTLGVGNAVLGIVQILVSSGALAGSPAAPLRARSRHGSRISRRSIRRSACADGAAVGALIALTILLLRRIWFGRSLYVLGGNPLAADCR